MNNSQEKPLQFFGKLRGNDEFVALPLSVLEGLMQNLANVPASSRRDNLTGLLNMCTTHDEIETAIIKDFNMYSIPQEVHAYIEDNRKSDPYPKVVGKINLRKD